jgi:DNA polymerase III delta prime subunit
MNALSSSLIRQPFIFKYKPYMIDDFCMDENVKSALAALLSIDDLNILFIGNSCSGKTTLLNAIVREYYGLSKTQTIPETNILFINNLKEQGINFFRNDMKTFCQSHSTIYGKKKMIIIDDIDMINEQSQQVFRNYIDKYKHNIHFVSVCTNIQKVIENIQSRVHIIRIHPPNIDQIETLMARIVREEKLAIDEESRRFLLLYCKDSIRTLISYLEKIYILGEPITIDVCMNLCTDISIAQFENYLEFLKSGNLEEAIRIMYYIYDLGFSVIDIYEYFFTFIKLTQRLTEREKYRIIPFLCKYITIFNNIHEDVIELSLFTNNLYDILCCDSAADG